MPDRPGSRATLRSAVVWSGLQAALAGRGGPQRVLDAGGGTGGFAVPLAELGHDVTVVDPTPDSLAALERRADEAGVAARVRGVQGDLSGLGVLAGRPFDVVVCHGVLELVDDPVVALSAVASVVRPGGLVSILVASRGATVVARAVAGRFAEARRVLGDPAGRGGPGDTLGRRFTPAALEEAVVAAGLSVVDLQGIRVVTDLVPAALLDEVGAVDALLDLERALAVRPEFLALAARLHLLAERA